MPEKYNEMLLITVDEFGTLKNKPDANSISLIELGDEIVKIDAQP